jgi:hypothetical protein
MAVELLSVSRAVPKQRPREEYVAPIESAPPAYTPTSEYAAPVAPVVERHEPAPPTMPAEPSEPVGVDTLETFAPEPEQSAVVEDPFAAAPMGEVHKVGEEPPAWKPEPPPPAPSAATPPGRRRYGQEAELPIDVVNDEERRLHNDARRFARLLISEIKLYNEQKVAEGRQQGDLYDRLREYIDRSREMYDKRVKAEVAARYDYFHGELVNTLAEGDVSRLGSNYPGATVTA